MNEGLLLIVICSVQPKGGKPGSLVNDSLDRDQRGPPERTARS